MFDHVASSEITLFNRGSVAFDFQVSEIKSLQFSVASVLIILVQNVLFLNSLFSFVRLFTWILPISTALHPEFP